ncbi:MAG: NADH-quinone oxidoreductase subunit L [Armatimonadota bacterium]|nr:NADH-quinone oxidoreductase subunit L [Armatimonadota bacterium]MDR5702462.1 NADH-quinone oxidoreductase subunit L [Armatimonadota bacterium]MDR7433561.1 NADH-quinone oxidoreductase subunit L [Armatimonadota bacterium]
MRFVLGILVAPLAGMLVNGLVGGRLSKKAVAGIACVAVGASFVGSLWTFLDLLRLPEEGRRLSLILYPWVLSGEVTVHVGLLVDTLSGWMALLVSGVSFLIHLYSTAYMGEDPDYSRYFTYLNFFVFSMLLLVLADNLLLLFVGWELVGLCSYLLIGFWFERPQAAMAGRKAFVVNRIGDAAFLLGIVLLLLRLGTVEIQGILHRASDAFSPGDFTATVVTLLLFTGATGKSAQLPLYLWLPDAMEGPTPVSALIHAATMVTAGVYMIARLHPLFSLAPLTMEVILAVGTLTALFAASVAITEQDLKRVLAYSTISQLGYMFMAAGVGAFAASIFHLTTHAFFKALLFLAAGAVMHAVHGETNLQRLGGLWPHLPATTFAFLVGALALAGIPPLSGYYSKDLILLHLLGQEKGAAWVLGVGTAFLTAVYIGRAATLTFFSPAPRTYDHVHEAPPLMATAMWILVGLAALGGWLGASWGGEPLLRLLAPVFMERELPHALALGFAPVLAGLAGLLLAWAVYLRGALRLANPTLSRVVSRKFYIEELYQILIVTPGRRIAQGLAEVFDPLLIDGVVNGVGVLVRAIGAGLRLFQTGYLRNYALVFLAGTLFLLGYWLFR